MAKNYHNFAWIVPVLLLAACSQPAPVKQDTAHATEQIEFTLPRQGTATQATMETNAAMAIRLNLDDADDMARAKAGYIAQIPGGTIYDSKGNVVWDQSRFAFVQGQAPATVNPSLWR